MCATPNLSSSNMTEIEAFEVHHWPIVRGYADRIRLVGVINDLVPTQMEVEPGTIVLGMVLDTLSGRSPLYHLPRFFEGQDTELLLGQAVAPDYFNDDNVARVLDLIYEKGTNLLFAEVAMAAVKAFNVPIKHVHFDTTSVTLHGDYEGFDAEAKGPHVTFGYSKDKRPDLKQFMQTLLCAGGGIPLLGKPENGNASDKTLNNDLLSRLSGKMAKFGLGPGAYLYIADSAMVTEDNLKTIADETQFITRLPATYGEHGNAISRALEADRWQEIGRLAVTRPTKNRPGAHYRCHDTEVTLYGKKYRAVVIHSSAHDIRRGKKLSRLLDQSLKEASKKLKSLEKEVFYCEKDAIAAVEAVNALPFPLHQLTCDIVQRPRYKRGRPKAGEEKQVAGLEYCLNGVISEREDMLAKKRLESGCFVLLTNVPQSGEEGYSGAQILEAYKDQHAVERNFSFLKDDAIVNAMFLKTPARIEAEVHSLSFASHLAADGTPDAILLKA